MNLIPLFVAIPLAMAFVMPLFGRLSRLLPDLLGNAATLALAALSCAMINLPMMVYKVGGWEPVNGVPIGIYLVVDGLAVLMLLIINVIGFAVSVYSIEYMRKYTDKARFYTLFLLMMAGMNGVVISGDMFNLYVFLEVAAIASYALVAFGTEAEELEAAFKYQVMGTAASGFILVGIAVLYSLTGTLNMADAGKVILEQGRSQGALFAGALFLMGFGLKAAIMPFHAWLPDAHPSAPAPISAMLSGVLIKAIGIYALCRIFFNVIGLNLTTSYILMAMGALSMIAGVFLAIGQWDMKRLFAYHSISQMGYVVMAIGIGTPLAVLGGLFHLVNHATFKSLLFLNSGAVVYSTGNRDLQKMGGLNQRMPVTGATSLIASMSIAGIPPFNGFWSKLIIILAAVQAGYYGLAALAVVGSIMTLASFLKVQRYGFFGKLRPVWKKVREAPVFMCVSMVLLALLCVGMGLLLLPGVKDGLLDRAADAVTGGTDYSGLVLGK
ncbi:monovalent cation/H+ antiporter subunit D family protein [bacterium]|nr:monovalent cation/H+ antiporter subunit D family protein [bacterium]